MELYGYENVYRVTNYEHPFDGYKGQKILVFEEFRNSIKIQDMLNYLDVYPIDLPCRYADKAACYTNVFIISNIDLAKQYLDVQAGQPETWEAFLRRIKTVRKYSKESNVPEEYDLEKLEYKFIWNIFS